MLFVSIEEVGSNLEPEHIARKAGRSILGIPISGDLDRVLLGYHRVEKGLLRKSWRELAESARTNEFQFTQTCRSIQGCQFGLESKNHRSRPSRDHSTRSCAYPAAPNAEMISAI